MKDFEILTEYKFYYEYGTCEVYSIGIFKDELYRAKERNDEIRKITKCTYKIILDDDEDDNEDLELIDELDITNLFKLNTLKEEDIDYAIRFLTK